MNYKETPVWKLNLGIFGAYIAISIFVTYPVIWGLISPHTIPGDHYDSKYFLWQLWWMKYAVLNLGVVPTFTEAIFHPIGGVILLASPLNELAAVILQPLMGLTRTYTLLWLFSFPTTAFTTYLLGFYFTHNRWAGFIGGLIFSFSAYHYAHGMHLGLWTLQWLPLYALALFLFIKKNSLKRAIFVVISFILATMSEHVYYMFYFIIPFTAFFFLYHWYMATPVLRQRKFQLIFSGLMLVGVLLVSPLYLHLLPTYGQTFVKRTGLVSGSADILAYFIPAPQNPAWGWNNEFAANVYDNIQGVITEDIIFIGYVALVLMIFGIMRQPNKSAKFWFILGILAFVFSLGPILHIYGPLKLTVGNIETHRVLPYVFLMNLPVFSLLRAPARLSVMVQLAVAVLAVYGLAGVTEKLSKGWRTSIYMGLGVLILFESLYQFPYPLYQDDLIIPEIYEIISRENNDLAILEIPSRARVNSIDTSEGQFLPVMSINKGFTFNSMYYATYHGHPLVGGESARTPLAPNAYLDTTAFIRELTYPTGVIDNSSAITSIDNVEMVKRGAQLLAKHNIGYVIIHRNRLSYFDPSEQQIPELMLRQALGEPFYDDENFIGFRVNEKDIPSPTQETLILGDGWYPKANLYNYPVQGMLRTGNLMIFEPEETLMRFSITAFSVMPEYKEVTVFINGTPVETFSVTSNPQAPETHFTHPFVLLQGFNEVEFQVQTDLPKPQFEAQVYLGVYNISQYNVLGIQDVTPTIQTKVNLGNELELIGYDQNVDTLQRDETLRLAFYWRSLGFIDNSYKVFIHWVDSQGNIIFQQDAIPFNWLLPTNVWEPDKVIIDEYNLTVPPDVPLGQYQIFIGMYTPETAERLKIFKNGQPTPADRILLGNVYVN